ncbi:MAG TPA: response regulator [Thermoanaerobaculia bacterium]
MLIADDDQAIRQLVCTIVQREGLEVDCVADGQEAIEQLSQHSYAVILLDLMMPRLDGFGVIEYLKEHPPAFKPVILVITAYADQKFKEVDPNVVSGVLRKPFEVADLGNLVRLCVHGYDSQTRQELMSSHDRGMRDLASHLPQIADRGNGAH